MFCVNCGSKLEESWSHCAKCGSQRGSAAPVSAKVQVSVEPQSAPKKRLGCLGVLFIVIVVGAITSAFTGGDDEPNPSASPTLTSIKEAMPFDEAVRLARGQNLAEFAASSCSQIKTDSIGEVGSALARFNEKASSITEPRKALAFLSDQTGAGELLGEHERNLNIVLTDLVASIRDQVDTTKYTVNDSGWVAELKLLVITNCPDLGSLKSLEERAEEYERQSNRLQALADSVPWFPDGYSPFGIDSRFAYKNLGGTCDIGDSCARFKLVGNVSCQDLYIEVNFLDSAGVVVDWGNELLTLPANQIALVDIGTYSDTATWQITELNCR